MTELDHYDKAKLSFYHHKKGNDAGIFMNSLWNCFHKADYANKTLLGRGFPFHLAVYMDWLNSPSEDEFFADQISMEEEIIEELINDHGEEPESITE